MKIFISSVFLLICVSTCHGWSEPSHHLIALIAFDEMTPECQQSIAELIKAHPYFDTAFQPPDSIFVKDVWQFGRLAFWPEMAGQADQRPNWKFFPTVLVKIGNPRVFPAPTVVLTSESSLQTLDLNLVQAIKLCRQIVRDKTKQPSERALALSWLCNLIGNAHNPCHTGLLVSENQLPKGDGYGSQIPVHDHQNLFAFWNGIIGNQADEIRLLSVSGLAHDERVWNALKERTQRQIKDEGLDPETWVRRTQIVADRVVYCDEVIQQVKEWESPTIAIGPLRLSKELELRVLSESLVLMSTAGLRLGHLLNEDLVSAK